MGLRKIAEQVAPLELSITLSFVFYKQYAPMEL